MSIRVRSVSLKRAMKLLVESRNRALFMVPLNRKERLLRKDEGLRLTMETGICASASRMKYSPSELKEMVWVRLGTVRPLRSFPSYAGGEA